ncbi:MAG: bifunctional nuclease family protein [Actinomycetales bacterium]|jgi:bifunctional DNase/RNase|nr:bifunctional nuclease family protein [Actinomycetales bacterium]
MVQVRITGLALDTQSQPVLILKPLVEEEGTGTLLPIWIGPQEATSILMAIQGDTPPRPMTHDLMKTILDDLGAAVERVEITRIEDGTFYAEITLRTRDGVLTLDARPSDSIALATRAGAPIWVADDVIAEAGVVDATVAEGEDADAEVAAFSEFLEHVNPEDFREE